MQIGVSNRTVMRQGPPVSKTSAPGGHRPTHFWLTEAGHVVTRNDEGHFIDPSGTAILERGDVHIREEQKGQGHILTVTPGAPQLEFAFMVLAPAVVENREPLPLILFLHHGWDVFRGTDNDGRILEECPLFSGEHSLVRGPESERFPAVLLVPQMIRQEESEGVTHEWAAFTQLDSKKGTMTMAEVPSRSARLALRVVDDLLSGKIEVNGGVPRIDARRVYVAGHSMGGLGAWDLLVRRPGFFAGAVIMAGYPDWSKAAQLTTQPLWVFHHENDCYNVIDGNQGMIERIMAAGGSEETTRFTRLTLDTKGQCDQAHFRTPEATWQTEGVFEWLFSQRLPVGPTDGQHSNVPQPEPN